MFHLSVLPLTRQLTNISGNLWGKTLQVSSCCTFHFVCYLVQTVNQHYIKHMFFFQGARAQRVEYLLLHSFHAKKFIVPDKISSHMKENKIAKRRVSNGVDRNAEEENIDDAAPNNEQGKGKKGPAYAGGLVLEPKKGLYDKYILLLDFNSLYPSIIQVKWLLFLSLCMHTVVHKHVYCCCQFLLN